jgi:hypothetical protein
VTLKSEIPQDTAHRTRDFFLKKRKKAPDTTIAQREAYFINRSGAWKQKKSFKVVLLRGSDNGLYSS